MKSTAATVVNNASLDRTLAKMKCEQLKGEMRKHVERIKSIETLSSLAADIGFTSQNIFAAIDELFIELDRHVQAGATIRNANRILGERLDVMARANLNKD